MSSPEPIPRDPRIRVWLTLIALSAGAAVVWSPSVPIMALVLSSLLAAMMVETSTGFLDLRFPTIPGVWFLSFQAMLVLPVVMRYSELGAARDRVALGLVVTQMATASAIWIVCGLLSYSRREASRYVRAPMTPYPAPEGLTRLCTFAAIATLLTVALYLIEVPAIPLLHLASGDADSLIRLREASFKLLNSRLLYLYALTRSYGLPYLAMVTMGLYLRYWRRRDLALWMFVLVQALFFAAATIARLPVAQLLLLLVLYSHLATRGSHWRRLGLGAVGVLAFPMIVVMAVSDVGFVVAIQSIVRRLFTAPADVLYWYFALFPEVHDFLGGHSIGKLAWVLGADPFNVPNYVAIQGLNTRIQTANANAAYPGGLYADFGFAGLFIGSLIVGLLLSTIQLTLTRGRKHIVNLATYCFSLYCAWLLQSTAVLVVLATHGWIPALVSPLLFYVVSVALASGGMRRIIRSA
jgi:hypothetical protein